MNIDTSNLKTQTRLKDSSDIEYVIATAKLSSFHSAASALSTNQSTVGRRELAWWNKRLLPDHQIKLRVDSASVYVASIRNGIGIGLPPNFYKHAASDLIALPIATDSHVNLWMVSRPIANKSHRVMIRSHCSRTP